MRPVDVITPAYRSQQQALHRNPSYGVASRLFAPLVAMVMAGNGIDTISDYGAGKRGLLAALRVQGMEPKGYHPYDPAFPAYGVPVAAPLVCCIDVLEHVEPSCLEAVLLDLAAITPSLGFFTIHCGPAGKTLDDGRNAHLIQAPSSWWLERIARHFGVHHLETHELMGPGLWLLVGPRQQPLWIDGQGASLAGS